MEPGRSVFRSDLGYISCMAFCFLCSNVSWVCDRYGIKRKRMGGVQTNTSAQKSCRDSKQMETVGNRVFHSYDFFLTRCHGHDISNTVLRAWVKTHCGLKFIMEQNRKIVTPKNRNLHLFCLLAHSSAFIQLLLWQSLLAFLLLPTRSTTHQ